MASFARKHTVPRKTRPGAIAEKASNFNVFRVSSRLSLIATLPFIHFAERKAADEQKRNSPDIRITFVPEIPIIPTFSGRLSTRDSFIFMTRRASCAFVERPESPA